ncbi:hypothetical protein CP913_24180 [Pseudomonas aeruginosa]|nr:hypothetical protein CP913_24180 [Pseudomonas aeruginosa]MCO2619799.1 hypothetical protein [Pseudomonas aeruginosa]PCN00057.1 hypothetical protein CP916_01725 [Pseudomonas aeruginosa]PCN06451.1 hypothetical protein CP915_03205 [Pseudomonas aeruginosa]PCN16804.1 hypothetical protein CP914_09895 [Pseudomonas aeruginosa]
MSAPPTRATSHLDAVMTDFPCLSQSPRSGGESNPRWTKLAPSSRKGCRSQFFAFQRLKASFNQFMPGLRARFVWKQNDSTVGLAPI